MPEWIWHGYEMGHTGSVGSVLASRVVPDGRPVIGFAGPLVTFVRRKAPPRLADVLLSLPPDLDVVPVRNSSWALSTYPPELIEEIAAEIALLAAHERGDESSLEERQ